MRLIHARTLVLEEFFNRPCPPYAILSHTWETEEVSYLDMFDLKSAKRMRGFVKIQYTCDQARRDKLEYVWVDTCCIDKRSSAELQEAINSMYKWYKEATTCYVYLSDILSSCPPMSDTGIYALPTENARPGFTFTFDDEALDFWKDVLIKSRWFRRGWTLQELIAPREAQFYVSGWQWIGMKSSLTQTLSTATHIDTQVLNGVVDLSSISVAKRMSWAAKRRTTRIEDEAYSLLGIMGINMPLLYGEGSKAFMRLQEQIIKTSNDLSVFAWDGQREGHDLFAKSPSDFQDSHDIVTLGRPDLFEPGSFGVRISCPVITPDSKNHRETTEYLAVLNCRRENTFHHLLALHVRRHPQAKRFHVATDYISDQLFPGGTITTGRLQSIDMRAVLHAEQKTLEITNTMNHHSDGVTFMFRLSEDAGSSEPSAKVRQIKSAEAYWRFRSPLEGSVRMKRAPNMKIGVLVEHSGGFFNIPIGKDFGPFDMPEHSQRVDLKVSYACRNIFRDDWYQYSSRICRHGIDCGDATGRECGAMGQIDQARGRAIVSNPVALTARMKASEVFGELVCDIQASIHKSSDMPMAVD